MSCLKLCRMRRYTESLSIFVKKTIHEINFAGFLTARRSNFGMSLDAVFSELDVGTSPWAAYVALWDFSGNPKPALGAWQSWLTRPLNSTRY